MNRAILFFAKSSIRVRLMILIGTAMLPVLVMSGVVAVQAYHGRLNRSTEAVVLARSAVQAHADAALSHLQNMLASASRQSVSGPALNCRGLLQDVLVLHDTELADLIVLDKDGAIRCSAVAESVGAHPPFTMQGADWIARLRQANGFLVGGLNRGQSGTSPVLMGGVPIVVDHVMQGAVIGGVRLDELTAGIHRRNVDAPAWLLAQNEAPMPIGQAAEGALPPDPVLAGLWLSDAPTKIVQARNGKSYTYASSELVPGYRLLAGYRASGDRAQARRALLHDTLEIAALALLGAIAMLYGAHRSIVQPLLRLNAQVAKWREGGGFAADAMRNAPAELQSLAVSFVDATGWLTQREMELRTASAQQELLMQEIHHRVKNNLQIVASLLNLQASRIRQPEARAEFQSARDRVRALATLHRHLYAHGEVHTINLRSFLMELCGQLFQAMGEQEGDRIGLEIEAPELQMSSDQAVPLALIVTEAVSNAVKYAFPGGRHGHVSVRLTADDSSATLVVQDDGVGIPAGRVETETGTRDGIGIQLIRGFARQLGAQLNVQEGNGTRYEVVLPLQRDRTADAAAERRPAEAAPLS